MSLTRIPSSMALPMMAGITDCATIQMIPKVTPPKIVGFCPRATHHR